MCHGGQFTTSFSFDASYHDHYRTMARGDRTHYARTFVYIFNAPVAGEEQAHPQDILAKAQICRDFFETNTNSTIRTITCRTADDSDGLVDQIEDDLANLTPNDLVIVWYYGKARGEYEDYKWCVRALVHSLWAVLTY